MEEFFTPHDELRTEIAIAAARLIAEDGYDYATARNKAVKTLTGKARLPKDRTPSDQEIQDELHTYQQLFQADHQPQELSELRAIAIDFMHQITHFEPIIYGAVVNGTASIHSDIHLLVFSDDPKEIDYWLLNQNISFDACEDALLAHQNFPAVAFKWHGKWFQVGVASPVSRRGLSNKQTHGGSPFQTDLSGLQHLYTKEKNSHE
jgi:hypothetical protein